MAINVLSLFDGMSCGQIALNRTGIEYDNYFASEIDKYAIKVTRANYPDTIQLGDIRHVEAVDLPKIDLLIGGSPCQGFSFSGKQLNFDDPRSALFFEFVRLLKECKPKYFLLENVIMSQESNDVISCTLGEMFPNCVSQKQLFQAGRLEPICINSALVSAQNRKRLYWTNIPGLTQPKDKGIILEDVLEDCSNSVYQRGRGNNKGGIKSNKSPSITSSRWEENVKVPVIKINNELIYKPHKSQCLVANYYKGSDNHGMRTGCIEVGHAEINGNDILKRVYSPKGKSPTLTAICGGNQENKIAIDHKRWRKLTPVECEKLQTVPDNYTNHVSPTQRYKMLGNGWTVDVIVHIIKSMKDCPE
ncbi:MAG: hypothetical protein DRQ46_00100 [Gammaproteobacteria bacterium]|nr:MAG: hypothetical protein DRQ46_00100 [Gammaproteobacteria bacterium]